MMESVMECFTSSWTWGFLGLLLLPVLRRWASGYENVSGRVVFITGGSEGIGRAMAADFVRRGANVCIMARTESKLKAAVTYLEGFKPEGGPRTQKIGYQTMDVTDLPSVENAMNKAKGEYGSPYILVTSAGASYPGYFLEQDCSVFERCMKLNYMGNVHCIKTVAPMMVAQKGGKIMIISSAAGVCGFIGFTSYSPTKFALRGFADALRSELNGFGIQVSCCYPPDTDTPGFAVENEEKPVETLACFPVDAYSSESVASTSVNSFLRGDYHVLSPDVLQNMLVSNMTGVTPRAYWALEVLLQPLICAVAAPFVMWFDYQARHYSQRLMNTGSSSVSKKND